MLNAKIENIQEKEYITDLKVYILSIILLISLYKLAYYLDI